MWSGSARTNEEMSLFPLRKWARVAFSAKWLGAFAGLFLGCPAFAQTAQNSVPATISSTTLETYQQEQKALMQEQITLMAQGATPQQLEAWHKQNAARFAAQQQRAAAMARALDLQQMPLVTPNIPTNASPALRDYLTTQAALAIARAKIHNQLVQGLSYSASDAQISQMHQQEMQLFQQQHASDLKLQARRAQALAQETDQIPLSTPPPLQIPPNASPLLKDYLTTRDQLMRDQITFMNQHRADDPATLQAAMQQWHQQNAARLQQLQEQAKAMAQLTTINTTTTTTK